MATRIREGPASALRSVRRAAHNDSALSAYPINTVGAPSTIAPPCAVISPIRAAGLLHRNVVNDPSMTESGGPTHTHMLPMVAAGTPAMITVGAPGETIGPPTCGIGGRPGVTIGQTCISPSRDAGCPMAAY